MIKRSLFVSLVATTFAVNSSAIDVYGKANLTVNDTEGNIKLNSNASRIGFKGSYDISEGLKAIYKFEYETYLDDGLSSHTIDACDSVTSETSVTNPAPLVNANGDSINTVVTDANCSEQSTGNNFKQSNIFAGFEGGFGRIIAGQHDTPTKLAQGKVDLFNDLPNGDIKNLLQGENRVKNIIIYTTPSVNGLKASFAYIPNEDGSSNSDSSSSSIQYKVNDLTLTVAYDEDKGDLIDGSVDSLTRYVAEYKVGDLKIGAIVQSADEGTNDQGTQVDEDAQIISLAYKATPKTTFKLQVGESDDGSNEISQGAFGIDYKLNKKSKLFAYYSNIEVDDGSTDENTSTIGAGYEIKF